MSSNNLSVYTSVCIYHRGGKPMDPTHDLTGSSPPALPPRCMRGRTLSLADQSQTSWGQIRMWALLGWKGEESGSVCCSFISPGWGNGSTGNSLPGVYSPTVLFAQNCAQWKQSVHCLGVVVGDPHVLLPGHCTPPHVQPTPALYHLPRPCNLCLLPPSHL